MSILLRRTEAPSNGERAERSVALDHPWERRSREISVAGTSARRQSRRMPQPAMGPPFDQFLATAEAVALARPEVDPEMAPEVCLEAATLLHNSLALDDLDEHDAGAVVAGLCVDLLAEDPGAAVRARSRTASEHPGDLLDAEGVSAAYAVAVELFQL
jgi:hypothetical protein